MIRFVILENFIYPKSWLFYILYITIPHEYVKIRLKENIHNAFYF
jgi:hypothetical protein